MRNNNDNNRNPQSFLTSDDFHKAVNDALKAQGSQVPTGEEHREPPHPPRKRRKRKKKGHPLLARLIVYPLLILLVLGSTLFTFWQISKRQVPTPIADLPLEEQRTEAYARSAKNIYFLLAGDDRRTDDEAARADTLIYTVLRPIDKKIAMVAIPRDTYVSIKGHDKDKINASLAYGGLDLLIDTVEKLTKAPVNHTVLVNFKSFETVIDAMGGVHINVTERMYLPEEGIDLEAGERVLNGHDALAFVRWRGDGLGDIGRIERQKVFMAAVLDKMRSLPPWKAWRVAKVLQKEVQTDLSLLELGDIGFRMAGIGADALEFEHFVLDPEYIDGVSYVMLDDDDVRSVVNKMRYGIDIDQLEE